MTREQEVERLARALADRDRKHAFAPDLWEQWGEMTEERRERYRAEARRLMHEIFGEPLTPARQDP